jgi:hypothetical protein
MTANAMVLEAMQAIFPEHGWVRLRRGYTRHRGPATKTASTLGSRVITGADSLTRTDDLPLTRRLLYQLSYAGFGVGDAKGCARRYFTTRNWGLPRGGWGGSESPWLCGSVSSEGEAAGRAWSAPASVDKASNDMPSPVSFA